jgi:signal transduction histidine kinase/AraC-like DNA-binding protein
MRNYKHGRLTIGALADWQVYSGILDTFLGPVYRGICAAAHDLQCNLMLSCSVDLGIGQGGPQVAWPFPAPGVDFIPVGHWNVDGLIAVGPIMSEARLRYLLQLIDEEYPVVFAGAWNAGPRVVVDNEGGIRQAVAHLVEHGHQQIAFIAGHRAREGDSVRRLRAYRAAVQKYGLEDNPHLVAWGSHTITGGRQAMEEVLETGASFTAVLASNDTSAIGAIQALRSAGLAVPQDIAVIGFDDRVEAVAHSPPLTTVRYPAFEQGCQAVALLLKYIEGQQEGFETVRIPTRLVVRESCGCLPGISPGETHETSVQRCTGTDRSIADFESSHERGTGISAEIVRAMATRVASQTRHLGLDEVYRSCRRLVEVFILALEQPGSGDPMDFHLAVHETLRRVMSSGDDSHAWQAAVSTLRDHLPALLDRSTDSLSRRQAEDMLDQARLAIAETTREQYTRRLVRQVDVANQLGQMAARFLAARDEAEIFGALLEDLPTVGIQHAAVAFYEPEGQDPVAWSVLQVPSPVAKDLSRFPSREFPPKGLYPEDVPFSLALLPLLVQDDVHGFVAFDTSNLELCADIVRQLTVALRAVWLYREAVEARRLAEEGRRLAEEANRLKSRFLSMVSHELRTPLNLICGLSDMLLKGGEQIGSEECRVNRADLERINVGAQHLDSLIRDVLDLGRSDVGQLKLICEPLNLVEVLEAASVIGGQLARDKDLTWRAEIPQSLPRVWGDRARLRQVVLNLVNNAVKFTARGGIQLSAGVEDGYVTVAVRDTGLGIPVEEQDVIFDEFRQSERTTARGYGGLGLGLAICKRLVEMHGGKIAAYSSGVEGEGSAFHVTLPILEWQEASPSALEMPLAGVDRVLILARDAAGGELLKERLIQRGFEVEICDVDGTTDWRARLVLLPPDMVVLDLGLTSEQGWEILKVLKENPATQDLPVLFYRLAGDREGGALLEMDYLTKPVGTAELAGALICQGFLQGEAGEATVKRILVADDEPGMLEMHTRVIETQLPDCQVLQAKNGYEALEVIQQERPDLVLLDLMMPELDGFGVLEAMQQGGVGRNIPVIVLTGQALTEEDIARLNQGVASVLGKGLFSVEETLDQIEAALMRRRKLGGEIQQVVRRAMAYIHEHYAEPLTRGDVARYVGLSERHLTRCFRQEVGVTPITYLNRYRVRRAKTLLESGQKGITEIAMDVGFSSGGYFARVFRQEVGVSPRAYQQGKRGDHD